MTKQAQKVALPAYMRKRLTAYVLEEGSIKKYLIKDKVKDEILALEPWQFFVLEILPGCDNFPKLASIFQDRFGNPVLENQIDELFSLVSEKDFFGFTARQHPMLLPYMENRLTRLNAEKNVQAGVSHEAVIQGNNAVSSKPDLPGESPVRAGSADKVESSAEDEAVAGISEAIGFNESIGVRRWHLFDPRSMLKHVQPWLMPLKNIIYILPLMLIIAVSLSVKHAGVISADLGHFLNNRTFVEVILLSMFTVNLLVTLTIAMVAHHYRATVNSISIVLIWGFIPRFMAKVGHTQQLSRRERMWLHVSPLLMRLTILSLGLFTWYSSRSMNGMLSELSLALAFISLASFVFTANPLIRSNGYHLLSAFLNEPHLRGKAYKALFNKIRGNVYKESDNNILAAYALASTVFMLTMFLLVVVILSFLLKQKLGGAGIMLVAFIAIYPLHRMVKQFRKIEKAYERSVQFDRWRKRALPEQSSDSDEKKKVSNLRFYLKKAVPYSLLLLMFFPYDYEPGGSFIIFPEKQQILTSDIEGIVDDVYYDGGEVLKKGVVIARLVSDDFQAQVNIYSSKMSEQQSVIDELRSRPRAEEVSLAERTLEVEKTRANFSKANVDRLQKLYTEGAISFDDLEEAKREHEVDLKQIEESRANLELKKLGATPDEISAAEARLKSWEEERNYYHGKINRSTIRMPFDGKLTSLHLMKKIGGFLKQGEEFAVVETTDKVIAEIEVPEADMGYIKDSADVSIQSWAYHDVIFKGVVTVIDSRITEKPFGKVIKVVALVENKDARLKSGMTGYAKIKSETMPIWKVFTFAIIRFFEVEVWSWIP